MKKVVILGAVRTPIAAIGKSLAALTARELASLPSARRLSGGVKPEQVSTPPWGG